LPCRCALVLDEVKLNPRALMAVVPEMGCTHRRRIPLQMEEEQNRNVAIGYLFQTDRSR
jgi:hypothetical protein